jgi:hypothetical protein
MLGFGSSRHTGTIGLGGNYAYAKNPLKRRKPSGDVSRWQCETPHDGQTRQLHYGNIWNAPHLCEVDRMSDKPEAPDALNRMIDVVLAYRPKPKSKGAKKRKRKQKKIENEKQREPT